MARDGDPTSLPWVDLQSVVRANKESLRRARAALEHECRVPLVYTSEPWSSISDRLNCLWPLAEVVVAEGEMLRQQGQISEAADCYFEVMHLSDAISRGGLLVDQQTGALFETLGLEGLRSIVQDLDEVTAAAASRRLLAFDADREPTKTVAARENAYRDKILPWDARWLRPMSADLTEQRTQERVRGASAGLRLLACHLALLRCRREHGFYPQALAELVPEYLAGVPLDPFGGRELVYKLQDEGYRLYSVGPNGNDDGGLGVPWPLVLTIP